MAFDKLMGFDRFINILIVISGSDTETYSRCKDSGFSYNVCINPFVPNAPFPYPLKTENCKVFLMVFFGGQRKGASGANWLSLSFRTLWIRKNSRFSDILNQCLFSLLAAGTVKFFSKEMFRACQNEKCVSSPPVGFCKKASSQMFDWVLDMLLVCKGVSQFHAKNSNLHAHQTHHCRF